MRHHLKINLTRLLIAIFLSACSQTFIITDKTNKEISEDLIGKKVIIEQKNGVKESCVIHNIRSDSIITITAENNNEPMVKTVYFKNITYIQHQYNKAGLPGFVIGSVSSLIFTSNLGLGDLALIPAVLAGSIGYVSGNSIKIKKKYTPLRPQFKNLKLGIRIGMLLSTAQESWKYGIPDNDLYNETLSARLKPGYSFEFFSEYFLSRNYAFQLSSGYQNSGVQWGSASGEDKYVTVTLNSIISKILFKTNRFFDEKTYLCLGMQYDYNYHANRYLTGNRDVISDINKNQVSIITGLQFPFLYDETRLNFLGNYYFTDLYKKNYQIYEIYPDKTKFTKYMISFSIDYLF